jgi:hypothetical protein
MHFVMTRHMMELHKLCRGCVIHTYVICRTWKAWHFAQPQSVDRRIFSESWRMTLSAQSDCIALEKHESKLNRRLISYYYEARLLCSKPNLLAAMTCSIFTVDLSLSCSIAQHRGIILTDWGTTQGIIVSGHNWSRSGYHKRYFARKWIYE